MLEAPLLMDSGFEVIPTAVREFTNTAAGPGRDRYRIRLDSNNALYAIQTRMHPRISWRNALDARVVLCRTWNHRDLAIRRGVFQHQFRSRHRSRWPQNPASAGAGWFLREAPITIPAGCPSSGLISNGMAAAAAVTFR